MVEYVLQRANMKCTFMYIHCEVNSIYLLAVLVVCFLTPINVFLNDCVSVFDLKQQYDHITIKFIHLTYP